MFGVVVVAVVVIVVAVVVVVAVVIVVAVLVVVAVVIVVAVVAVVAVVVVVKLVKESGRAHLNVAQGKPILPFQWEGFFYTKNSIEVSIFAPTTFC